MRSTTIMSGPTRFKMLAIVTVIKVSVINVFTLPYRRGEIVFPENEFIGRVATNQIDSRAF